MPISPAERSPDTPVVFTPDIAQRALEMGGKREDIPGDSLGFALKVIATGTEPRTVESAMPDRRHTLLDDSVLLQMREFAEESLGADHTAG